MSIDFICMTKPNYMLLINLLFTCVHGYMDTNKSKVVIN